MKHRLSKQHKDVMTLPLINTILSMDTTQARPETYLHPPRHKRILKLGTPMSNVSNLSGNKRRHASDSQVLIHPLNGGYPQPKRQRLTSRYVFLILFLS